VEKKGMGGCGGHGGGNGRCMGWSPSAQGIRKLGRTIRSCQPPNYF